MSVLGSFKAMHRKKPNVRPTTTNQALLLGRLVILRRNTPCSWNGISVEKNLLVVSHSALRTKAYVQQIPLSNTGVVSNTIQHARSEDLGGRQGPRKRPCDASSFPPLRLSLPFPCVTSRGTIAPVSTPPQLVHNRNKAVSLRKAPDPYTA